MNSSFAALRAWAGVVPKSGTELRSKAHGQECPCYSGDQLHDGRYNPCLLPIKDDAVVTHYYERNLPHWQPEGRAFFVTWRLWGSLPASALARVRAGLDAGAAVVAKEHGQDPDRTSRDRTPHPTKRRAVSAGEYFAAIDRELDRAQTGPRWLQDARAAKVVVETLLRGDRELGHYNLRAFVVMPNHVHILNERRMDPVRALKGIKGTTAREINRILGRTGRPFWQDESFDRWVRNESEFDRIRAYIERNPVKAGFVSDPEDWPWSSAAVR
jgi:putative transposase